MGSAHQSNVFAAEFLPFNEEHLASGGNDADLKYFNLETEEGTVYSHHTRKVLRMTVHNEHTHSFMTCSADGTVRMIDTRQPYESTKSGPIDTVQGREGNIRAQALGGGLTAAGRHSPLIESSLVVKYHDRHLASLQLYSVDFNPMNGHQFIVASEAGDVRLFDLRSIRNHSSCSYINIWTHKIGSRDDITGCAFSKDGQRIVMTALGDAIYTFDANFNFEKEAEFPLCIHNAGLRGYEACESSEHQYSLRMLNRIGRYQSNRPLPPGFGPPVHFGDSDDDDDEEDEEDEEDEDDEAGDDDEYDVMDALDALEATLELDEEEEEENSETNASEGNNMEEDETVEPTPSRRARWERRNRSRVLDVHEDDNAETGAREGEDNDNGDNDDDNDPLVTSQIHDFLQMFPPDEDGAVAIDLMTLMRLASRVNEARRQRAAGNPERTSRSAVGASESSRRRVTPSRASPHGPNAAHDDDTIARNDEEEEEREIVPRRKSKKEKRSISENEDEEEYGESKENNEDVKSEGKAEDMQIESKSVETLEVRPSPKSSSQSKEKKEEEDILESKPLDSTAMSEGEPELPQTYLRRFTGHASVQTIKGVGFWGPNSEFLVSGSDDANTFIWDVENATLLNVLEGHDDVVNCVVGHPRLPLLATSGIDDIIILWEPCGPTPTEAELETKISRITAANTGQRRRAQQIQCGTQ